MSGAPFRAPLFYPPAFGFAALSGVFAVAEPVGAEAGGVDAVGVTTVFSAICSVGGAALGACSA
ncbi:MAG: hypothetical protein ACXW3V_04045, partial [Methylocystis sp.]